MAIQTINSFNNQVVKIFQEMSEEAVNSAIARAEKTFESWKHTSYEERAAILHRVAALIRSKSTQLAELITLEMGKLIAQSTG